MGIIIVRACKARQCRRAQEYTHCRHPPENCVYGLALRYIHGKQARNCSAQHAKSNFLEGLATPD